jgi:hypothetical protein
LACINIHDQLSKDPRFKKLQKIVGAQLAWGVWIDAAMIAQEFWKKDRSLIPRHLFSAIDNHQALLESGLVEEKDHGFYLLGSRDQFDWMIERIEAASNGGKAKAEAEKRRNNDLASSKTCQNVANAALSLSLSLSEEKKEESQKKEILEEPEFPPLIKIWNENSGNLQKVKKTNPTRNRKAKNIFAQLEPAEWVEVVQRVAASSFCSGKNDRGWRASFDWLLQPEVYLKVIEGKYDDRRNLSLVGSMCGMAER